MLPPARLPRALPEKPETSSLTAPRADRLAQGFYLYNLTTTTTPTVVDYNLIFKLVDHYDEVGLERQLSVSYLLSDEAPFNGYDWT